MQLPSNIRTAVLGFGLSTLAGCGGRTVSGVPLNGGEPEPQFVAGTSRQAFAEDFERYTDATGLRGGGWALTSGADSMLELGSGTGTGASRALGFYWPAGEGWLGAEHAIVAQPNRVSYASWEYRAPSFQFVGPNPDQQGIKHLLINNGTTNRITIGLNTAMDIGMVQSNGAYLWVQPNRTPWGSQQATVQRLIDGSWHRLTVRRTQESSNRAMDGAFELWVDGEKLFDLQRIGTGTLSIEEIELAGTFNGGSPKDQRQYYDNVRIWY